VALLMPSARGALAWAMAVDTAARGFWAFCFYLYLALV
jgi:hypothetical protein